MCGRTRISEHLRRPMEVLETQERWINWSKEVIEIICPVFWMCVLMYTLIHVHVLFWRMVLSFCKGAKNHWVYVCIYIHIHLIFVPTLRGRTSKSSVLCQVRCLSSLVSCIGQLLVINALEPGVYREVLSPFCLTCQLIRHSLLCSSHLEYSAVWSFPEKNMLKKIQIFFFDWLWGPTSVKDLTGALYQVVGQADQEKAQCWSCLDSKEIQENMDLKGWKWNAAAWWLQQH